MTDLAVGEDSVALLAPPGRICFVATDSVARSKGTSAAECHPIETGYLSGLSWAAPWFYSPLASPSGWLRFQPSGPIETIETTPPVLAAGYVAGDCVRFVPENDPQAIAAKCFAGQQTVGWRAIRPVRGLVGGRRGLLYLMEQVSNRIPLVERRCDVFSPGKAPIWSGPCPIAHAVLEGAETVLFMGIAGQIVAVDDHGVRWSKDLRADALPTAMRIDGERLYFSLGHLHPSSPEEAGVFQISVRGGAVSRLSGVDDADAFDVRRGIIAWVQPGASGRPPSVHVGRVP